MSKVTVGQFIKGLRESRKLSLTYLALSSGVGKTTIFDVESGATPRLKTLQKLLNALDSHDDLVEHIKVGLDQFRKGEGIPLSEVRSRVKRRRHANS